MLRRISATPCPVAALTDQSSRRDSVFDASTTNLDFTTDFTRANLLTDAKTRRRQTTLRKEVVIHEDEFQEEVHQTHGPVSSVAGSLLARPAKRLRGRVNFAGDVGSTKEGNLKPSRFLLGSVAEMDPQANVGRVDTGMAQPPRRRISTVGPAILKTYEEESTLRFVMDQADQERNALKKPPRRGTIYIPPEDTTMPSMYMGVFSPVKDVEDVVEKAEDTMQASITGIAAEMARRRGRRSSLAAEPARRVGPLRSALAVVKERESSNNTNDLQEVDRVGASTGKENLPPGFHHSKFSDSAICGNESKNIAKHTRPVQQRQKTFVASMPLQTRTRQKHCKPAWNSGACQKPPKKSVAAAPRQTSGMLESRSEPKFPTPPPRIPSRFILPKLYPEQRSQHYPPLCEDICNPAMYEDSWLTHQEIAITQLLNSLFSSASSQEPVGGDLLRFELLDIYQSSQFVLLHKRIQGAILYGALRVPENILSDARRLQNDLGMRENFIDLWMRTYDRGTLKAALEVVVGRQCSNSLKDIKTFFDVFIIRNEDGSPESECTDLAAWSYRRTLLRSLLIIKLLDNLKTMPNTVLTASLFLTTSPIKTSFAVLQKLTQMLNPSMSQRALNHLEYAVECKQNPLEEFEYPVANLAVDLRDGVRLTRLVELLLYPSASTQLARDPPEDTMMTLNMPTGEVLSILDLEFPTKSSRYPLSQHLKFPCESRVVKLFNVEIALTALRQIKSMHKLVDGISADDIVDGFREKTVALLWGLTGKWGLGALIDWIDVRSEISRFQRRNGVDENDILDEEELEDLSHNFTGHKTLLKAWAASVASSRGLKLNNLTTSFADGKIFEAIVDEYETYLPSKCTSPWSRKASLQDRLAKLGCSTQFSSLFAASTTGNRYQIFDHDCILAALTFLCSRLLSVSKRTRASVVIQRAWRSYQLRCEAHKQKTASVLATQCAAVVVTRERILDSKMKILAAWRAYKAGDKKVLDDDYDETNLDAGDMWLNL